ncbi:MAG TPA: dihydrodipicolinate synthase family protein [Bryobacteraceae bacterium]|nr:dihydrodipicolinate synthase family protein [Bryobacteraceae bacterium]
MSKLVTGVYAAVLTLRHSDGTLDENGLAGLLGFLSSKGLDGFAFNGATGEFYLTTPAELERILAVARDVLGNSTPWLCGVGSAGLAGCVELGAIAARHGARGLLLPMPYFFPYEQSDLEAFCREATRQLPLPSLLYNLPQFTTGLAPETSIRLIAECHEIVGIKDSSGSLDTLRMLTRDGLEYCRIVGHDGVLVPALTEGICDGVISGVAGVLPELVQSIFDKVAEFDSPQALGAIEALDEFVAQIGGMPTPWGLKWIAESRGIARATFAQPLSGERIAQGERLKQWFQMLYSDANIRALRG